MDECTEGASSGGQRIGLLCASSALLLSCSLAALAEAGGCSRRQQSSALVCDWSTPCHVHANIYSQNVSAAALCVLLAADGSRPKGCEWPCLCCRRLGLLYVEQCFNSLDAALIEFE